VPLRAQYIRVMFDEITRILNHLLWLGAHGLDIGAMTVFLYCFREREDLMDCYEAVSGTRMHAAYYRPGGIYRDLPESMPLYQESTFRSREDVARLNANRQGSVLDFIDNFVQRFPKCVDEYETLLTDNRIWKQRTVGIGVVTPERAMNLGFTGPMLRGSGIEWDLRKKQPYDVYERMDFDEYVLLTNEVNRGTDWDDARKADFGSTLEGTVTRMTYESPSERTTPEVVRAYLGDDDDA